MILPAPLFLFPLIDLLTFLSLFPNLDWTT